MATMQIESGTVVFLNVKARGILGKGPVEVSRVFQHDGINGEKEITAFIGLRNGNPIIIPDGQECAGMNAIISVDAISSCRQSKK